MAVFTVWFLQDSNKHGRDDFKAKPSSVTLRILINHLQTLLLVGGLQNHGPELYRETVSAPAKVAEGGIVSSLNGFVECVLELNFFQRTYIVATLPLLSFAVACLVYFCIKSLIDCWEDASKLKQTSTFKQNTDDIDGRENPTPGLPNQPKDLRDTASIRYNPCSRRNFNAVSKGMVRVGAVSMFLIHSSVVDQLLSALQYSPPIDGKHFLLHSMNYSYMEGGHVIVVSVVVIFLVLYVLVLPIVTTLAIFSQFNVPHKRSEWINKSIGFLTKGYRRTYMWWEVGPVLIRKMLLMLTSRIVASSFDQSLIALLIVAIAYNLQVTIRPFDQTMYLNSNSYANDCEQLSLGTITVSLFVSLLYTQLLLTTYLGRGLVLKMSHQLL